MKLGDPLDPGQGNQGQVDEIDAVEEVCRMKGVIGGPGDGPGAEEVKRQANRNPQRHALDATRKAGPVERRFHLNRFEA